MISRGLRGGFLGGFSNVTVNGTLFASQISSSTNVVSFLSASSVVINGPLSAAGAFRLVPGTAQTADYTALTSDRNIVMNVTAGGTLTMPTTPLSSQRYEVWNLSGNALTIARAGSQTINGATSVSVAAGAGVILSLIAADTWRASEAPAA